MQVLPVVYHLGVDDPQLTCLIMLHFLSICPCRVDFFCACRLILSLQRATGLPEVDKSKHVTFNINVQAMGVRRRSGDYPLGQTSDGVLESVAG